MSGPLRDRLDLIVEVESVPIGALTQGAPGEPSADVRARVLAARERQTSRPTRARVNANLTGVELKKFATLDAAGRRLLERSADKLHLSARGFHRIIRVSRTTEEPHRSRIERGLTWAAAHQPQETAVAKLLKGPPNRSRRARGSRR